MSALLMRLSQRQVLWLVFSLNAGMFFIESILGWVTHSASLLADSLDMFADAAVYALSLYAMDRSRRLKAEAAAINAGLHLLLAALLLAEVVRCTLSRSMPEPLVMSSVSIAALVVNASCVLLLHRFRQTDINLRATWICSRNDMLGNLAVFVAAIVVHLTESPWPDRVVGLTLAGVMAHSAWQIGREALWQRRQSMTVT